MKVFISEIGGDLGLSVEMDHAPQIEDTIVFGYTTEFLVCGRQWRLPPIEEVVDTSQCELLLRVRGTQCLIKPEEENLAQDMIKVTQEDSLSDPDYLAGRLAARARGIRVLKHGNSLSYTHGAVYGAIERLEALL